jgi:hypothetical protein
MTEIKRGFEDESARQERDPQHLEFQKLFESLAAQHGTGVMLKYIESVTDVAPKVTSEWLESYRHPSSGIRKAILSSLRNFKPEDLPKQPEHLTAPLATAEVKSKPQANDNKLKPQVQRKQDTIAKNEAELKAIMDRAREKGQIT